MGNIQRTVNREIAEMMPEMKSFAGAGFNVLGSR
jgi:hypothetical protein